MKSRHWLLYIAALFLLSACTGEGRRMQALLEQAEEMNRTWQLFTTDTVMKPMAEYYDHWWQKRDLRIRSRYILGCVYRDLNNAPRALENYQRALSLTDTTDTTAIPLLMRIHSQMSEIYMGQRLTEEMLRESKYAARLAWKIGDTESALILQSDYCHVLYINKKYEECITEALKLYNQFIKYGYKERGLAAYANCVKSYLAVKDYPHAKAYLDLYETCPFFKTTPYKINGGISSLYLLKGQYFLGVCNTDSAEIYFRKLLQPPQFESNELLACKGLCKVFALRHNADSVLKYTQLYSIAKEQDFDKAQTEATLQAKSLYDYTVEQQIAQKKTEESTRRRNWIYALAALCLGGTFLYLYQQERRKREISELRNKHHKAVQELRESEARLLAARLGQAENDNQIVRYQDEIKQKQAKIEVLESEIRTKASWEKKRNLEDSAIVRRFHEYRTSIKDKVNITNEEWKQLQQTIELTCPNFHAALNTNQPLNDIEYQICLLIKIGFTPSDIDIIFNKEYTFASKTRTRIAQKLLHAGGKGAQLDKYIHSLW